MIWIEYLFMGYVLFAVYTAYVIYRIYKPSKKRSNK